MLIREYKLKGKAVQYRTIDRAIRTVQFVRNKAVAFWQDAQPGQKTNLFAMHRLAKDLATEFPFVAQLGSQARQLAAERASISVTNFYRNCREKKPGKKGYPRFQKNCRSVEYSQAGWKLSEDCRRVIFTDKNGIGSLKLVGTIPLNQYPKEKIKRVRIVRRADGYYVQFVIDVERQELAPYTGSMIGLDVGLTSFLTDSNGEEMESPRFLRKTECRIKKMQRQVSKKQRGSANRRKARTRLGRAHLKVQRQRIDFATKLARALYQSHDLIAYENLQVRNMVKNHRLAKSISDAAWSLFRQKLEYYARLFGKVAIPVDPRYTSQMCSSCGAVVKKTLSERTHACPCGAVLDRDHNAAMNILALGIQQLSSSTTGGHPESNAWGEDSLYPLLATASGQAAS